MFKITLDLSYLITALISSLLVSCLCNEVYNYIDIYYTYSKTKFYLVNLSSIFLNIAFYCLR